MMKNKKLTVIGDVHGTFDEMVHIVDDALSRDRHIVFLGDLTDRGPNSVGVLNTVMDLYEQDKATVIFGNHDDKFMRWAMGNNVNATHGIQTTIAEFDALPDHEAHAILQRFLNLSQNWYECLTVGNVTFAHGGFHKGMLNVPYVLVKDRKQKEYRSIVARANYGKTHPEKKSPEGYKLRLYDWVDDIPNGHTVYLGHDVQSVTEVVTKVGAQGGKAVFVDTGAGKDGFLSGIDVDLD